MSDSTSAHTRPERAGDAATPILPSMAVAGRPRFAVISVHVVPPSVERHSPLPGPPLASSQKLRCTCHRLA